MMVIDHVTRSALKKALLFKVESRTGCASIWLVILFAMKLSRDMLYPEVSFAVESRKPERKLFSEYVANNGRQDTCKANQTVPSYKCP
jgi:hypothetical protein